MEVDELEALRAAALAGHVGDAATARRLVASPHAEVRAAALGALARLGDDTLGPAVLDGLADGAAGVRRRAVELTATLPQVPIARVAAVLDLSLIHI